MLRLGSAIVLVASVCWVSHAQMPSQGNGANFPSKPSLTAVNVLRQGTQLQVEVITSAPASVRKSKLSNPDRLVFDFPNFDGPTRRITVSDAPVSAVRAAIYQTTPPVARIVIDLVHMVPYEVRTDAQRTVISLELGSHHESLQSASKRPLAKTRPPETQPVSRIVITESPARVAEPKRPNVGVDAAGLLTVRAEKCSFIDVLTEVAQRYGAQIEPADDRARDLLLNFGHQPITVNIGPATAREVVKTFFQGSPLDYIVIESATGDLHKIVVVAKSNAVAPDTQSNARPVVSASHDDELPPPSVKIVSPLPGAVLTGTVSMSASAEGAAGVAGVQFNLDGNDIGAEATSEPYQVPWDTTAVPAGTHVLGAVVRDLRGNSAASATVIVSVSRK